jgi:hypothetical protein
MRRCSSNSGGGRPTWWWYRQRETERSEKIKMIWDKHPFLFSFRREDKTRVFYKICETFSLRLKYRGYSWVMVEDKELWKFSISFSATTSLSLLFLFLSLPTQNWMNNRTVVSRDFKKSECVKVKTCSIAIA